MCFFTACKPGLLSFLAGFLRTNMLRTVFAGAVVATAAAFAPAGPVRLRCRERLELEHILAVCGRHAAVPRSTASSLAALSYSCAATAATAATAAHRRPRHSPDARAKDVRGLAHAPRMRPSSPCSRRCVPGSRRRGREARAPRMCPGSRRTAHTYRASRRERGGGGDDRPSENGPQHGGR
jgi:hypothetical protein